MARLSVSASFLTQSSNLLGMRASRLQDWIRDDDRDYGLQRTTEWNRAETVRSQSDDLRSFSRPEKNRIAQVPRLRHTDRTVRSPINLVLWDRAQWVGTVFAIRDGEIPVLGLGFLNQKAAEAIFREWKERWQEYGPDRVIRVAIVKGLAARRPSEYAMVIGPTVKREVFRRPRVTQFVSRINRMTPSNSRNLDAFVERYSVEKQYLLAPTIVDTNPPGVQKLGIALGLVMKKLEIREAWKIGPNDIDQAVLYMDDDPHIPEGINDPPVHRTLEALRRKERGC